MSRPETCQAVARITSTFQRKHRCENAEGLRKAWMLGREYWLCRAHIVARTVQIHGSKAKGTPTQF